jgi:group II intron reverse transcriptase/maturase
MAGRYRWVVEADIRSFFDTIDHEKLLKMVEKRVNDQALTRLIRKWLRAGIVLENGDIKYPEEGTVQGNIISPILANIYLHYALDQWFERTIKPGCKGQATLIRYADDFVACFEHERPATNFYKNLPNRFKGFGLEIAEEKTKKLKFNRFERESSESFTFLGFVYTRDISRKGNHIVRRKTDKKKFRNKVQDFKKWCKENRHRRTRWIMEMVKSKMRGFRNYYGVSGNGGSINALIWHYTKILFKWLNRRSQRRSYNWDRFNELLKFYNVFSLRRLTCEGYQLNFLSCFD